MTESKKTQRAWNYTAASRTLPYVRLVLRDLREHYIRVWHLYRLAGNTVDHPDYGDLIRFHSGEGRTALAELKSLGIVPYQSPLRGIALFPFIIREGKGVRREMYFVYKDSRDSIDTFIFEDDLGEHNDLYGFERAVPDEWKEPETIPRLERETK